jgi:acetyl-CoA/propionyl-CoA carboxylase biotin carboxyl carrier protein
MFDTVLIANRGEIAVRIIASLRRLGIRSVAVYSDADADARHVREADLAVRIGPASPVQSYLHIEHILDAARSTGVQAIHPGYGFLSENANFVRACTQAGFTFIGPSAEAVEVMGDKIRAKLAVMAAGVPVVPGRTRPEMSDADLVSAAGEIGFPVIVKPSAGGGGKGMRLVETSSELPEALIGARREAVASFGSDALFLERFVVRPRHIEVQVVADVFGTTVHLGERECSLQRRHQKVVEEAPSVLLDAVVRTRIGASAIKTAQSVGYTGVGTVEFIVSADAPDEFFFMEMNTRLQVEHPVTEMISNLDLVEQQLLIAAGEPLAFAQADVRLEGHAIEARIYAEDPARDFLPTGGRVLLLREPHGEGIRVDSSLREGMEIGTSYDPMLAKVIAFGADRRTSLARLERALSATVVLGVTTNTAFLRELVTNTRVRAGELDTGLIERELESLVSGERYGVDTPIEVCAAFALYQLMQLEPDGPEFDRWEIPDGWRLGVHAATRWMVATADASHLEIAITSTPKGAQLTVERRDPSGTITPCAARVSATKAPDGLMVTVDGISRLVLAAMDGDVTWLWIGGFTYALRALAPLQRRGEAGDADGELRSPMPGAVIAVNVTIGDIVEQGDRLVVIEAMKMEHALTAPFSGVMAGVFVSLGDQVVVGQPLARVDLIIEEVSGMSDDKERSR